MGHQPELPLFAGVTKGETTVALPSPTRGQDIVADYASLGLSLAPHPLALLRSHLRRAGLATAAEVRHLAHGAPVRTGGIVINRQQPASARGVIFVTLEDETGHVNLVVWQRVAQRQRRELLGARLMAVSGEVQREGEVVHVVARRLSDWSALLGGLQTRSRDFR